MKGQALTELSRNQFLLLNGELGKCKSCPTKYVYNNLLIDGGLHSSTKYYIASNQSSKKRVIGSFFAVDQSIPWGISECKGNGLVEESKGSEIASMLTRCLKNYS